LEHPVDIVTYSKKMLVGGYFSLPEFRCVTHSGSIKNKFYSNVNSVDYISGRGKATEYSTLGWESHRRSSCWKKSLTLSNGTNWLKTSKWPVRHI
jgi:hypothetical protein